LHRLEHPGQRVFYSLRAALKATQAFPAVGESTFKGDAARRREDTDAPTLEAEIGALIREAGDSLREAPTESPQAAEATWISGRASEFESLPPDQIGITVPTASGWDHRSGTGIGDDDLRFRLILTTGVLLAALGIAWMGGLGSNRFFSPSHKPLTSSSAPHFGSEHENSRPATTGDVAPNTTGEQNVVTATSLKLGRGQESPHGAAQPAAAPTKPASKVARQNRSSAAPPEAAAQQRAKALPEPRPAPTPETRPTTIPGWTVREVIGGTVILEGPNGPVKVTRGNMVPGLGKIDSIVRWGSRWIVATSKGLIATQ
jgi:hypothetical protein